jgi:hypothetical protein
MITNITWSQRSFRYVPSAGEKITANVSGQHPSLNISGKVKEIEFDKSDTVPSFSLATNIFWFKESDSWNCPTINYILASVN